MDQHSHKSDIQHTPDSSPMAAPWLDLFGALPLPLSLSGGLEQYPYIDAHQFPIPITNYEYIDSPHAYTSPKSTASEPCPQTSEAEKPRRRENRYRNAPPGVLSRRRAQNRASQRAYRERKEQRIRDLEDLLQEASQREESLAQAYTFLRTEYEKLLAGEGNRSSLGTAPEIHGTVGTHYHDPSLQQSPDMYGGFSFDIYGHNNTGHDTQHQSQILREHLPTS